MIISNLYTKTKYFKSLHKAVITRTVIRSFSIDTSLLTSVSTSNTFINIYNTLHGKYYYNHNRNVVIPIHIPVLLFI